MYERGRPPIRLFLIATREEPLRQSDYTSDSHRLPHFIIRVRRTKDEVAKPKPKLFQKSLMIKLRHFVLRTSSFVLHSCISPAKPIFFLTRPCP